MPYTSSELSSVAPCSQIVVDMKHLRKSVAGSAPGADGLSVMRIEPQYTSTFGSPEFKSSMFVVGTGLAEIRLREPWKLHRTVDAPRNALHAALAYRRGWTRLAYDEAVMISEWRKLIRLSWFGSMRRRK